jgi:hypothetical protein
MRSDQANSNNELGKNDVVKSLVMNSPGRIKHGSIGSRGVKNGDINSVSGILTPPMGQ